MKGNLESTVESIKSASEAIKKMGQDFNEQRERINNAISEDLKFLQPEALERSLRFAIKD